jgi:hypothetical protein
MQTKIAQQFCMILKYQIYENLSSSSQVLSIARTEGVNELNTCCACLQMLQTVQG